MSLDERLLQALQNYVDVVDTKHIKVIAADTFGGNYSDEIELPDDRRKLWMEPCVGVYIVNVDGIRHFSKRMSTINELFELAVNAGYDIESLSFKVPQREELFEFQPKASCNIAIATMFSPNANKDCWLKFIQDVELPEGVAVDILMGDNTGGERIKNLYAQVSHELAAKYSKVHIADLGAPYDIQPGDHYLEQGKHCHIALNYSRLLRQPVEHYDYILKIEDDVSPPADGLSRLYRHMQRLEDLVGKIACVAGAYRQKITPDVICASLQRGIWGKAPKVDDLPKELFRVEMQGGGFSLYSCKALREVLPYHLTFKRPNGAYYMTGWDGSIGEAWANTGWSQYCDGSVYCEHHF